MCVWGGGGGVGDSPSSGDPPSVALRPLIVTGEEGTPLRPCLISCANMKE